MKKIGLVALFALLLAGCDDGGEKKAQENLRKAEAALEKENFNEAKLQIDSIRILYPKAFEARKQGVKLMQQVDLKEQQKSLICPIHLSITIFCRAYIAYLLKSSKLSSNISRIFFDDLSKSADMNFIIWIL